MRGQKSERGHGASWSGSNFQQATEWRGLLSSKRAPPSRPHTPARPLRWPATHDTTGPRPRAEQDGDIKRTSKGCKEVNACEEREQAGEQVADERAMAKRSLRVQTSEQLVG